MHPIASLYILIYMCIYLSLTGQLVGAVNVAMVRSTPFCLFLLMIKQNSAIEATGLVPLSKSFPFLVFFFSSRNFTRDSPAIARLFLKNIINFLFFATSSALAKYKVLHFKQPNYAFQLICKFSLFFHLVAGKYRTL